MADVVSTYSHSAAIFEARRRAQYLLERLRGIYKRLPPWMQAKRLLIDNNHEWHLSNGSVAYAFPTTAGDSYTASMAIVDEADLVPNLDFLMNAVKPTIDGGGRMILLSRSNKEEPQSPFKRMYLAAKAGKSPWKAIFLPWYVRPDRDQAWYQEQMRDILARTTSLDDLWQQYPADDSEALIPRTLDKRIPAQWVTQCYVQIESISDSYLHSIEPRLCVYHEPEKFHQYVIGLDPAEGNPQSDPSALVVLDTANAEEVCMINERIEPSVFSQLAIRLAHEYNNATLLPERNNHGHVVIAAIHEEGTLDILAGMDGLAGWHTNSKSKSEMYSTTADAFKDKVTTVHSEIAFYQLCGIVGSTLSAPEGENDDVATAFALGLQALTAPVARSFSFSYVGAKLAAIVTDRRIKLARGVTERYNEGFFG